MVFLRNALRDGWLDTENEFRVNVHERKTDTDPRKKDANTGRGRGQRTETTTETTEDNYLRLLTVGESRVFFLTSGFIIFISFENNYKLSIFYLN